MRTLRLEEMFDMTQGLTYGRHASEDGKMFTYLQVGNLKDGEVDDGQESKQETLNPEAAEAYIPRQGMLLVTLRTQDLRTALVAQDMPEYVVSNNLTILSLRKGFVKSVRPGFVGLILRSDVMRQRLAPLYRGGSLPMLSLKDFKQLTLGLPSLEVQDAFIAAQQALRSQEKAYEELLSLRRRELEAHVGPFAGADA